jgi:hypothetical protein
MNDYHWLLLKNGRLVIGTKGDGHRVSWAVLMPDGSMGAVNDHEVLDAKPVRKPKARVNEQTVLSGTIGE